MTLSKALANVDIQLVPGSVYNCEAGGCQIASRVKEKQQPEPIYLESDTMLNAWVDLPAVATSELRSYRGSHSHRQTR